ncbi:MAG TPA: ABC transporter substrate-binding protein [Tepidisphaeraceae bacterium]|nr:ABC transporter substrate-binding protein [Tepidisphaeraceae bacterium]
MQKVKWFFFGYLLVTGALIAMFAGAVAFSRSNTAADPSRDANTLYTIYASNVRWLDPAVISDVTSADVADQVFENLYNYDINERPYQIIPELAVDLPEVSEDGLTVTIRLKKGIRFVDPLGQIKGWSKTSHPTATVGPEITVDDFFFAWKRVASFHMASQNYSHMIEGRIKGLDEWFEYTRGVARNRVDWDRPVEGLEKIDAHTMRLHLKRPDPQLRYNLAHLPMAPVSREAVEQLGDAFQFRAIGSGPYMITEYKAEQRIIYEANPTYRGHPTANVGDVVPPKQRLPRTPRVQMDYVEEDLPAWAMFRNKQIDISGIPKDSFAIAIDLRTRELSEEMKRDGVKLRKSDRPVVFFFGFNMVDPVVGKNKPLRQAMSMAFDRERYIDLIMNGRGIAMKGITPPGFPTYDPNRKNAYAEYNLEAAREKMKEAVKVQGGPIPDITLLMPGSDTTSRQMGELMQQMMRQIGVKLRVDYTTWARFQEMVDAKQAQFFALGWQADYPDEQTFFQLLYGPNSAPGPNASNYNNPAFNALYEKTLTMEPGPERDELYRQMEQIALEDVPWVLNFTPIVYTLYYEWVEPAPPNTYTHGRQAYTELDVQLRQRRLFGWETADQAVAAKAR